MFECHENGIIEELKSVWNMVWCQRSLSLSSIDVGAGGSIKRIHCRRWYICEKCTTADKGTALFMSVAIFCLPIHFVGSWPCQKVVNQWQWKWYKGLLVVVLYCF